MSWLDSIRNAFSSQPDGKDEAVAVPALPEVAIEPEAQERAVLVLISTTEGTLGQDGYHALYGWRPGRYDRMFSSYDDHPNKRFYLNGDPVPEGVTPAPYSYTTAAGKYQWTFSSWRDMQKRHGDCDFSPQSQDVMTLNKIEELGALDDVHAGRLQEALNKMGGTWASLPTAKVAQPHRDFAFCCTAFTGAGGTLA